MKTVEIVDDLRQRIVGGEFSPGSELPRRHELLSHYGSSVGAFQKCINRLIDEGFLESRGVKGTLVKEYPPHLYRIGIVIPAGKDNRDFLWDSFWQTFSEAVHEAADVNGYSFSFYYDIKANAENSREWRRLEEDIRQGRLSGLIVLEHMRMSASMQQTLMQLPMVAFTDRTFNSPNALPVRFDYALMLEKAVRRMRELGRKRVAVLVNSEMFVLPMPEIRNIMAKNGLTPRTEWIQGICLCPHSVPWTTQLIRMLFHAGQREIPDGLIVLNENLLDYVFEPLAESRLEIGGDVEIISHGNFPCKNQRQRRISRVGFDSRQLVDISVRLIEECRRNGGIPNGAVHLIPAVWENDLMT